MKKKALAILMAIVMVAGITTFGTRTIYASEAEYPNCIQPFCLTGPPKEYED